MMTNKQASPFRIAVREEGVMLNAYFAPVDSMEGAMLFASFHKLPLLENPELYEQWLAMLRDAVRVLCKTVLNTEPASVDFVSPHGEPVQ